MLRTCVVLLLVLGVQEAGAWGLQDGSVSAPRSQAVDTGISRFESGVSSAAVRTPFGLGCCPVLALGPAASININHRFAIDAELLRTPSSSVSASNFYGGHITEFLAGIRSEIRARKYGYFLKAQSGFLTWDRVITGVAYPTPGAFTFVYGSRSSFVADLGAGFEFSPASRIHLRAGVGDLITRQGRSSWTNNVQPHAGLFVGLGRPLAWRPPVYSPHTTHPFWDQWNIVLVSGSVLAMTADSITTQRFINQGQREGNPLAAPLVKYGWSGQASVEGMETAALIMGIYGLHRIGHHWMERLVPCAIAAAHGILAFQNTKASSRPAPR